ncbi:MAG: Bax inhibitor-1 family protein [Planctomycetota bacterium]
MNDVNPYAHASMTPAALATAEERAAFLRRTYGLLLAAVLTFAGTLWAAGNVEPVRDLATSLGRAVYGSRFGGFLYLGLFLGGGWLVHAFAERRPINVVLLFAFAFLLGLLMAPLIYFVLAKGPSGVTAINQAALLTGLIFSGLTAYVFFSGRSFSFLGGALSIGLWSLVGIGLAGWLFGFSFGIWYSVAGVVLFVGYILYDTDAILRRYPTTAHVSAACVLFTDVVILFQHLLSLLSRRD